MSNGDVQENVRVKGDCEIRTQPDLVVWWSVLATNVLKAGREKEGEEEIGDRVMALGNRAAAKTRTRQEVIRNSIALGTEAAGGGERGDGEAEAKTRS
jgi:hypothetical protein